MEKHARALFDAPEAEAVAVEDAARGIARIALIEEGRVIAALFASPEPVEAARGHVLSALADGEPAAVLAGRPGAAMPDAGAIVCACFDVGVNTILTAIETRRLVDVEGIGQAVRAGTNCGSCRPELQALLDARTRPLAAE